MSLFPAPGWDDVASQTVHASQKRSRSAKRKRTDEHEIGHESADLEAPQPNLQKLMKKLEQSLSGKEKSASSQAKEKELSTPKVDKKSQQPGKFSTNEKPYKKSNSIFDKSGNSAERTQDSGTRHEKRVRGNKNRQEEKPKAKASKIPSTQPLTKDTPISQDKMATGKDEVTEPKLTELQRKMKQKLSGGRFRMINEQLYTSDSSLAHQMMKEDPNTFDEYHIGFRHQVQAWPSNPVELYTKNIQRDYDANSVIIADLGCGDASLAKMLVPKGYRVLSFDLVSDGRWVIEADVCKSIPLPGATGASEDDSDFAASSQIIDICICALSLMGTNWLTCISEARRILKTGGLLEIAEVTSRFTDIPAFQELIASIGFDFVSTSQPSSHFVLFSFKKNSCSLTTRDRKSMKARSQELLTPCIYKRR